MDIINTDKKERILLNQARIKLLQTHKEIQKLNFCQVITMVLSDFVGGKHKKPKKD